jgi:hypothetical protein
LPILDSLQGGFLELRRVRLIRYLEHFLSFRSSLYMTCRRAKLSGEAHFGQTKHTAAMHS